MSTTFSISYVRLMVLLAFAAFGALVEQATTGAVKSKLCCKLGL